MTPSTGFVGGICDVALLALTCNTSNQSELQPIISIDASTLLHLGLFSKHLFIFLLQCNLCRCRHGQSLTMPTQPQRIKADRSRKRRQYSASLGRDLHMSKLHVRLQAYHMAVLVELDSGALSGAIAAR